MNRRSLFPTPLLLAGAAFRSKADNVRSEPVVASTQYGGVRGVSVNGVSVFRGIPYGGPTQGSARFLPPSKPAKWTGIRDARETGPRCVQAPGNLFLNPIIGEYFRGSQDRTQLAQQRDDENCLVLNVLTPGLRGKRPVLVYIHGGGFTGGSSVLTLFADAFPREQDVVLVGVNHRLNAFGYLFLGDLNNKFAQGNAGQLDLIASLEWVRNNIAGFGGDPDNVTIFGESGGGAKISTLLAMPQAKGLFHKAIVESGSLLRVGARDQATATARAVLAKLGLDHNQTDRLQTIPASDLLTASSQVTGDPLLKLAPVIDGHSLKEQTWDPKAPDVSAGVPMIIGCCKDEGSLFALRDEALFRLEDAGLLGRVIKAGIPEPTAKTLIASYRNDYPGDTPTATYFRMSTDRGARWNAIKQAERKLQQGKSNVFMYYFAWDTPCADGKIKAFHTAELPLAMRLVRYPESEQLSRQISGAWAAFARHGDPTHKGLPDWPRYSAADRATMIFKADASRAVNDPDRERRIALMDRPSGGLL